MKTALFSMCIADVMFPQAAQVTVHLLECLGHEVYFPERQGCCGQMHVNTGYYPEAMLLIRNHVNIFIPVLDGQWDAIVAPSGLCTELLRHQALLVVRNQGEPQLAVYVEALAKKTYDLPELLVNVLGMIDIGVYFSHRVTYHTTCHSLRMVRTGDTVTWLIAVVRGTDHVLLPDSDICCGFGGTFSLKNPEVLVMMLSDRMVNVISTGAEAVVADGYPCLMNIGGGLARSGSDIRSMHLAEVLVGTEESPRFVPATNTKVGM